MPVSCLFNERRLGARYNPRDADNKTNREPEFVPMKSRVEVSAFSPNRVR
jgi:hypothetical protein